MLIVEAATRVRFTRGCAQSLRRLWLVGPRMTKQIPPQCPVLPSFLKKKIQCVSQVLHPGPPLK